MLRLLLKKQLMEVFQSYFYDAKRNRMRTKGAIVGWFVFFFLLVAGVLGGSLTMLSLLLCGTLTEAGLDWLYFLLMGGIAVLLGAFGSAFNTYASLYLPKDNDQLLSLPIPLGTILAARLVNVYLLGTLYAATTMVPALLVYWFTAGATAARVLGGAALFLLVSAVVLLLSCLLGWVVAKLSVRFKNKSFVTVLLSLAFLGGYYFFYFKASLLLRDLVANAASYGARIKGASYALYLFGRIGEGDWTAAAIFFAVTALCLALVWRLLRRGFLSLASGGAAAGRTRRRETPARQKSVFGALLGKELARFTSSPSYMLNCGLGVLLIPAVGVLLLIKGREVCELLSAVFADAPDAAAVLLCAVLCLLAAMNDMAAPSVSLEGKSLWVVQSLPVAPRAALRAKLAVQLLLTALPLLFAAVCAAAVLDASVWLKLLTVCAPLSYCAFSSVCGLALGIRMPLLHWTSETAPTKQGGAVMLSLFGGWALGAIFAVLYPLVGYRLGAAPYLLLWSVLFAAAALALLRWLDAKGATLFASLG